MRRVLPVFGAILALILLVSAGCAQPKADTRPLTYVAIGASDTVGVGARDPEREGWVPRFAAGLGPNVRTINLGVSGSTLGQALREQLGPAVDADPDLVTVWLAVNDLNARIPLDQYAADLDRLLGSLRATGARVLVANVPDLPRIGVYAQVDPQLLRAEVRQWNDVIGQVTERHGAELVDLNAAWRELAEYPEYISSDDFHPSSEGYARLADLFLQYYRRGR